MAGQIVSYYRDLLADLRKRQDAQLAQGVQWDHEAQWAEETQEPHPAYTGRTNQGTALFAFSGQ
ncbi:hypothetical protein [Arthrobacter sp. AFG20]|uniref:hypothetical protein n=1 Tax=Arthrobacter sp. AFG20 TaxID=1688671 RepID=UPI0021556E04|nr:hypothetical protein [Arthrobacter sp. AFG20]